MRKRREQQGLALFLAIGMILGSLFPSAKLYAAEEKNPVSGTPLSRVNVHDPSIIKADGTYYIFGTHMADARSTDLVNWTQINKDWNARETPDAWKQDSIYGDVLNNYARSFEWAGYNDANCSNDGLALWAPDVKYNPYYEWKDGTKGAYMLYYSASSTWKRSCIGYAVAKEVEGPYEYVDTILYSGFSKDNETDQSQRDTKWDNDYLHFTELIKKGTISDISDNWFTSSGSYNTSYCPNAIDPTLFFDADQNLYLVYGSWSGGLWIHSVDRRTGGINYPGEDRIEDVSGNVTDRYFGTRVSGGNGQSGEGPYIYYDKETEYFYLYETYGGLEANGGYNMRLFRSKYVYGSYVDAAGRNARENKTKGDSYGIKLIGNYQFTNQPGYRSAGHNSALFEEGKGRYLVYHQRFDELSKKNKGYHEVRVRQQFLNEDNWPVHAVYENRGETIGHYQQSDVTGAYEIINHGTKTEKKMLDTQKIELHEDGTITGDVSGTWEKSTKPEAAYDFVTLRIGDTVYKGFFFRQWNEKETPEQVMTFSAIGNDNTCLWGTHCTMEELEAERLPDATLTPALTGPDATPTPSPTAQPKKQPLKKGQKIRSGAASYKVTNPSRCEISLTKAPKNPHVVVPDTVLANGTKYRVTAIGEKAFARNKNLKKVSIGKNVVKIAPKAFYHCRKCKSITIRGKKLKKIGKSAFCGIHKKAVFAMPQKKKKQYRKYLSPKTGFQKTMKIKTYKTGG